MTSTKSTRAGKLIVFPRHETAILGYPATLWLTNAEAKAIERVHLGGLDALRTKTYRCRRQTIDGLIAKGLLHANGPTGLGRSVGRTVAENSLNEIMGS